jgi:hemoglobin
MSTFEERSAHRARIAPGAAAGVTEPMIAQVVHSFYARIRRDPDLGPIFETAIGDRWDAHLAKLCDFWSSVLLMTGRFRGAPMPAHIRLPGLSSEHFERWLGLWRDTVRALCPPEAAALFTARAEMIAQSLQLGIAAARGELPPLRSAAT